MLRIMIIHEIICHFELQKVNVTFRGFKTSKLKHSKDNRINLDKSLKIEEDLCRLKMSVTGLAVVAASEECNQMERLCAPYLGTYKNKYFPHLPK